MASPGRAPGELEKGKPWRVEKGQTGIQLQGPFAQSLAASTYSDLLIDSYGKTHGAEVTTKVLRAESEGSKPVVVPPWKTGEGVTSQPKRLFASSASADVWPLTQLGTQTKPSQMVTAERADTEKMQMLYELMPHKDTRFKSRLYSALEATNPDLVKELEGGHFVEWHQEQLIKRASLVDEVLALLCGDILDHEQYLEICTEPGKMRKLYELVPSWDTERKDRLYEVLKETNSVLVQELEGPDGSVFTRIWAEGSHLEAMARLYELVPSWGTQNEDGLYRALRQTNSALIDELEGDHFVEWHREQLIQRVSPVDAVLRLLRGTMLNYKQYQSILAERSDPERMRKLYELVPHWDTLGKDWLYQVLAVTNPALIKELEGEHFVEQHHMELIWHVSRLDKILARFSGDVLSDEQSQIIRTDPVRMQMLYKLVPSWETWRKGRLYQALKVTDSTLVQELEGAAGSEQGSSVSTRAGAAGEHFVERHREQLIERVSSVDQVLDLLRRDVLEPEAYRSIRIYPETMRKLYDLVQTWDRRLKDRLYEALKETNRTLVEELEGEHFVDRHREQLIQRVAKVDKVLNRVLPYRNIITGDTNSEKMRKLYELVPSWDRKHKDRFWKWLKETNRALIEELEGEHFVDRHQEQLIQRVSNVDTLCRRVLDKAQYQTIVTDPLKMRKLYELVPSWDTECKDRLYQALKETNRALVNELDGDYLARRKHFVDQHQEQLIQRVSRVNQVLDLLHGTVLSRKQRQNIQTKRMTPEAAWKLHKLPVHSQGFTLVENQGPEFQCATFPRYYPQASGSLIAEPQSFSGKDPESGPSSAAKTEAAGGETSQNEDPSKDPWGQDKCDLCPREQDPPEEIHPKIVWGPGWNQESYRGSLKLRFRSWLINQINSENYEGLRWIDKDHTVFRIPWKHASRKDITANDYKIFKAWAIASGKYNEKLKDPAKWKTDFRCAMRSTNMFSMLADNSKAPEDPHKVYKVISSSVMADANAPAATRETSRNEDPSKDPWGQDKCDLCPREQDPPEEIHPEIVWGPGRNQQMYRVHLAGAGSFRCSKTELGFKVRTSVTLQYGYDSWDWRLSASEKQQWMMAGPLFDIRAEPAGAVTAVHLPHFLCLAGGKADVSHLQVAHFVDCGMTLQSPTGVRPFHVVLEDPSFSPIGLLWKQIYSKLFPPVHTLVLLYRSTRAADITLHLYLIPRDLSVVQAIEDNEMKYQSKRVRKPSKSKPLYFGSCSYISSPSNIEVTPKELEFCNVAAHSLDPDMEIYTRDLGDKLELSLVEKKKRQQIWETTVRPGDVMISDSISTRAADSQDMMCGTLRDALEETLEELGSSDLKRFKSRLKSMKLPKKHKRIPYGKLQEADTQDVCDLLEQYYMKEGAVEVAIQALKGINQNELAEKLEKDIRKHPHHIDSLCSHVSTMDLGQSV